MFCAHIEEAPYEPKLAALYTSDIDISRLTLNFSWVRTANVFACADSTSFSVVVTARNGTLVAATLLGPGSFHFGNSSVTATVELDVGNTTLSTNGIYTCAISAVTAAGTSSAV